MADPIPYVVSEQGGAGEAPEGSIPIRLFGASGGGGGGSTAWVDITGKPVTFPPSAHDQAISTITGLQAALDSKAVASDVTSALAGKASTADFDNTFGIATSAQADATAALSGLDGKLDESEIITAKNVTGIARHQFIDNGGTVTNPTPFMVIIEDE